MVTVPHSACLAWARDRKREDTRARQCSALGMLSGREGFQADRMELAFRFHSRESSSRVCKSQLPPPRLSVRVWFPHSHCFVFLAAKIPAPLLLPACSCPPFPCPVCPSPHRLQQDIKAETVGCGLVQTSPSVELEGRGAVCCVCDIPSRGSSLWGSLLCSHLFSHSPFLL